VTNTLRNDLINQAIISLSKNSIYGSHISAYPYCGSRLIKNDHSVVSSVICANAVIKPLPTL